MRDLSQKEIKEEEKRKQLQPGGRAKVCYLGFLDQAAVPTYCVPAAVLGHHPPPFVWSDSEELLKEVTLEKFPYGAFHHF